MANEINGSVAKARHLRRVQTKAEKILWKKLRAKQFLDLKFRRQTPIDQYVLDFFCPELRLAIEIDGYSHQLSKQRDRIRDTHLRKKGIKVVRITNAQVHEALPSVMKKIADATGLDPLSLEGEGWGEGDDHFVYN